MHKHHRVNEFSGIEFLIQRLTFIIIYNNQYCCSSIIKQILINKTRFICHLQRIIFIYVYSQEFKTTKRLAYYLL